MVGELGGEALAASIGPSVPVLESNHDEAAELAGDDSLEDVARRERLLERLLEEGVALVFLTLGAKRVLVGSRDGTACRLAH